MHLEGFELRRRLRPLARDRLLRCMSRCRGRLLLRRMLLGQRLGLAEALLQRALRRTAVGLLLQQRAPVILERANSLCAEATTASRAPHSWRDSDSFFSSCPLTSLTCSE